MSDRTYGQSFLLSCGLMGSIFFTIFYFVEAGISPGYSSMQQAISDLEWVKYGWMQSANFIMLGFFIILFAFGLRKELQKGYGSVALPSLQISVAVGLILSGIFIREPLHTPASMVSFISLVISFFVFSKRFGNDPRWKGWAVYSISCGIGMMILLYLFGYAKSHNGPAGLFERLVVAIRSIWSLLFTLRILRGVRMSPLTESITQLKV
jgi:hypothetical membrane protein